MRNIRVVRIDDRLLHGQVVTAWLKQFPINRILIIDDELSKNRLMERIYKAAAPVGVDMVILSVADSANFLKDEALKGENLMLLVKVPMVLRELCQYGVRLSRVILGGMGAGRGRKTFIKNVSASQEETDCFRWLVEQGIEIIYQLVPSDKETNIRKLL